MAGAQANCRPSTSVDQEEAAAISSESHDATDLLVAKLPAREGWSEPLVLYKNYWLRPHFVSRIMRLESIFKPRRDDTILASNPKCGTTWLKALAFAITTRSRYNLATNHPLLSLHPQKVVPSIEIPPGGDLARVETLPSPRLLATHMPLSLFPDPVATYGCRVVYVCREPKDAFVSLWHFQNKIAKQHKIGFEPALNMFVEGFSTYGPFWEHCLEYWRASVARPDRVLFLKYEEMMSEPVKHVARLAAFLGAPFSVEEEEAGVPEEVVRLCSFDKLSAAHRTGDMYRDRDGKIVIENSVFFRKGKVGDWVNHMSEEMAKKIDCVVAEKLQGSGLVL